MIDSSNQYLKMWSLSFAPDPLLTTSTSMHHSRSEGTTNSSSVITAQISIENLLGNDKTILSILNEIKRDTRVVLADLVARQIMEQRKQCQIEVTDDIGVAATVSLELLDEALTKSRRRKPTNVVYPPYILERTDIYCSESTLYVTLRMNIKTKPNNVTSSKATIMPPVSNEEKKSEENIQEYAIKSILTTILLKQQQQTSFLSRLMNHVACVTLQNYIRSKLGPMKAVAFVADGSILPRKSGTSDAPMASPPAVPFKAPPDSTMTKEITIEMGNLAKYLPPTTKISALSSDDGSSSSSSTTVTLRGLIVPAGVTLICGGGYHGKSTLLGTVAAGIYDKIPGDGREYCVAVRDAVTVRAEDGRYVNNCNISAFISNLPTPPGVTKALDTQHFSTRDSSGSTSQASNVVEAIEMGATAMLVDEDVSAANFMARDGRMRSLVMDESITPLLYRVNGLYNTHGISSVVVVGGVGDWLDVPHNVILLDKYVASDATKKAQSISYQFSYGHVQYAGRGVVHRLEWDKSGTPTPRRPADAFSKKYRSDVVVSILDGGHAISLHQDESVASEYSNNDDDDDDVHMVAVVDDEGEGCIEASRLEQLLGRKQLYGCGICVSWILQMAPRYPSLGMPDLLNKLDEVLDEGGLVQILKDLKDSNSNNNNVGGNESNFPNEAWKHVIEGVGFAQRPRKYEVGQSLTRLHGIVMEELPIEEDLEELTAKKEAERKKQELLALWEARRSKN